MKVVVEPTGAGRGCLVESKVSVPPGSRVGVILSGGNVDVRDVCRWLGRP
jgi:threonine dehydratase